MSFLFGGSVDDVWRLDLARCRRQVEQVSLRANTRDTSSRASVYKEVRIILRELALLDSQLQKDIVEKKHSKQQLLKRVDELNQVNKEVQDVDKVVVGDGGDLNSTTSLPAILPVDEAPGQQTSRSVGIGSADGTGSASNSTPWIPTGGGNGVYASGTFDSGRYAAGGQDAEVQMPRQELMRQKLLVEQQEQGLDVLSGRLDGLKQVGTDIRTEIHFHVDLLEELQEEVEQQGTALEVAKTRLSEVSKSRSNKCLMCYILTLIVAIVFVALTI